MKFCPYCGADLLDSNVLFCAHCGKKLPPHEAGITEPLTEEMRPEQEEPKPAKPKEDHKKKKKRKTKKVGTPESQTPVDDGYDGYYDDVLPPDTDRVKEGLNMTKSTRLCYQLSAEGSY